MSQLANELSILRQQLRREAFEVEHDIALSEVAKAELAANAGDGPKTLAHLRAAGKWALEVATKIGTTIAADALKASLGLK